MSEQQAGLDMNQPIGGTDLHGRVIGSPKPKPEQQAETWHEVPRFDCFCKCTDDQHLVGFWRGKKDLLHYLNALEATNHQLESETQVQLIEAEQRIVRVQEELAALRGKYAELMKYHGCGCDSEVGHDDYCIVTFEYRFEEAEIRAKKLESQLATAVAALEEARDYIHAVSCSGDYDTAPCCEVAAALTAIKQQGEDAEA